MGWIDPKDKLPPEGLNVLVEASGTYSGVGYAMVADHDLFIAFRVNKEDNQESEWILYDGCGENSHIYYPTIHAWMPLPRHYQPCEMGFTEDPDLMEHSMFENDPEWLYKGDCVYKQMSLSDFLAQKGER